MLQTIVLILGGAYLFGKVAEKLGLPKMLGQMLVGIVLGPALLGWIEPHHWLAIFSEVGVVLLLFMAGLETDFRKLQANLRISTAVALVGAAVPLVVMMTFGRVLGLSWSESVFTGIIFSATSISITVKILIDRGTMDTRGAAIIVGAAVLDDLFAIMSLSIYQSWAEAVGRPIGQLLWELLGSKILFFVLLYSYAKWGHSFLFGRKTTDKKAKVERQTLLFFGCFLLSYLADLAGLSAVLGAFFFGVIVAHHRDAELIIEPVNFMSENFFLPFFFATIGLPLTFTQIGQQWQVVLVGLALAIGTKFFACYSTGRFFGVERQESLLIGGGMVARGEMALVLVNIGISAHYVPSAWVTIWVAIILGTTFATPLLLHVQSKKKEYAKRTRE